MKRWWGGIVAGLCLLIAGCGDNMWWEYRDDPYIADLARRGDGDVMRGVNAANKNERMMALRILATRAGEARRNGRRDLAVEMEEVIIRRYRIEKEPEVRACIVSICAPATGRGSTAMVKFLRERIASGEFPGYAALSLAAIGTKHAVLDIEPLTRHPAPEVRLQAANALVVLGDPRGFGAVSKVWSEMQSSLWPPRVEGVPLDEARTGLAARAERAFGRPLNYR
ncbi:MAG: HEAT repeat domain-containing protein [Planctomycetaceae bacterium]|nr:HEAT repeat domain-containing protein [Planctomycetaceae bacterium]